MVDGFRYLVVSAPQILDDDPQTCRGGLKLCPLQPQLVLPPWQVLPHGQLQHVNKSSSHALKADEICHEYSWAVSKAHWFIVNMGVLLTSRRGISQQSTAIAMPVTLGVQAPVEESSHLLGGSGLARWDRWDRMKISAFSARIGKMIHSDLCSPSLRRHDGGDPLRRKMLHCSSKDACGSLGSRREPWQQRQQGAETSETWQGEAKWRDWRFYIDGWCKCCINTDVYRCI